MSRDKRLVSKRRKDIQERIAVLTSKIAAITRSDHPALRVYHDELKGLRAELQQLN